FRRILIPKGDTMDHPLVNPCGPVSLDIEPVALDPILVVHGGGDLLKTEPGVCREIEKLG
ncbi:hypothetical protein R6Q59_037006, partial [Mikania micrantha]